MKKALSGLLATSLAATFAIASVAPVNAAPIFVPKSEQARSDVENVQYRDWRRQNRIDRRIYRLERRQALREARRDSYRRGDVNYYRGYRGYRYRRPGYREYDGWWFPAAAFLAGALVTGTVNDAPRYGGNSHVEWCMDRYRSYRVSDNSWQPNYGPRRQCNSPYD